MSDAFRIVAAAANSDPGRLALAEILADEGQVAIIDGDALSYLRISRDLPLPPGVPDHRADAFFRHRFYTGSRLSITHRVTTPLELLYFDFAIVMVIGTLADAREVRERMKGSGYEPVVVRRSGGGEQAIGIVMVNEFRDTTFGPYNEVVFIAVAVPEEVPREAKVVDYVNAFSLQTALDRGATTFTFKLWLNELGPIDGGNDYLGTNKELGCFEFANRTDGRREFRSWDRHLTPVVSGMVPGAVTAAAPAALAAYTEAARHAGTAVPAGTTTTIPVASRPDGDSGPATKWAFVVDWRHCALQEVTPAQVGLQFGENEWARTFDRMRFTPALSFYSPAGVGQITARIGDAPFRI
jgi:hypothetical protein